VGLWKALLVRKRPCGCGRWLGVAGWYAMLCAEHSKARPVRSYPDGPVFPLEEKPAPAKKVVRTAR
jgi:hypothetical protein